MGVALNPLGSGELSCALAAPIASNAALVVIVKIQPEFFITTSIEFKAYDFDSKFKYRQGQFKNFVRRAMLP